MQCELGFFGESFEEKKIDPTNEHITDDGIKTVLRVDHANEATNYRVYIRAPNNNNGSNRTRENDK